MECSIIIPTYKNYKYCKLTIDSIKKNSIFNHEIIVHINGNDKETKNYLIHQNIKFTKSSDNIGLCSSVNTAYKKSTQNFILYSHDDMYFLPGWDKVLADEVSKLNNEKFYLSLTQIAAHGDVKGSIQHIKFDCGDVAENFDEEKLLKNFNNFHFNDLQGSHWAPHLIPKSLWEKVGGFSEEFNPGFASDPDLNFKLWMAGNRIFKSVSKSRVYHFGSVTTRKNKDIVKNNGKKTFLLKWKMSVEFFTKYYLRRGDVYIGPLDEPNKNLFYYKDYFMSKFKFYFKKMF